MGSLSSNWNKPVKMKARKISELNDSLTLANFFFRFWQVFSKQISISGVSSLHNNIRSIETGADKKHFKHFFNGLSDNWMRLNSAKYAFVLAISVIWVSGFVIVYSAFRKLIFAACPKPTSLNWGPTRNYWNNLFPDTIPYFLCKINEANPELGEVRFTGQCSPVSSGLGHSSLGS